MHIKTDNIDAIAGMRERDELEPMDQTPALKNGPERF